jgi:hypothetical protein
MYKYLEAEHFHKFEILQPAFPITGSLYRPLSHTCSTALFFLFAVDSDSCDYPASYHAQFWVLLTKLPRYITQGSL